MAEPQAKPIQVPKATEAANTDAAPVNDPFDVSWFLRDNRIHIQDQSHFLPNNYLMIHPKELAPEQQQRTFAKLVKHMTLPAPSFLGVYPRNAVMFSLASFLPISKESRIESLKEEALKLQQMDQTGIHPDAQEQMDRYQSPFQANIKMRHEAPQIDPKDSELMQNAITLYLVINEALTAQGRTKEPAAYVSNLRSADGVLGDIADKFSMTMSDFVELAQTKGVDGIAEKLGVATPLLDEIKQVARIAAEHNYAENVIQNWDVGRHLQGMQGRSVDEKMAIGVLQRAGGTLSYLQQTIAQDAPVPEDITKMEQRILAVLREWPKEIQEALYYGGAELAFTSESSLGSIFPQHPTALGVQPFYPFEVGGMDGLKQIRNSNANSRGYLRIINQHEGNHFIDPKELGQEGIKTLETAIHNDAERLTDLHAMLDEWYIAPPELRPEIERKIDAQFRVNNLTLAQATGKTGPNPVGLERLLDLVDDALDNLDFNSNTLARGYPIPELRAEEVIPCFAERLHVKHKDNPALLGFMCPDLMVAYHDTFIPHVKRHVEKLKAAQEQLPEPLRYLGLPADEIMQLPQTQQAAMQMNSADINAIPAAANTRFAPETNVVEARLDAPNLAAQLPAGVTKHLSRLQETQYGHTLAAPAEAIR
jgi:hypothetical protein